MSNLYLTVALSLLIVFVSLSLLAIGWILTGKSKLRLGMCGRDPTQKKSKECGKDISCVVCGKKQEEEDDDDLPKRES